MSKIYNIIIFIFISFVGMAQHTNNCNAKIAYTIDEEISPLTVNFIDSSKSTLPIVSWEWDFGNGELSKKQNPNHQYLETGIYLISLKIVDSKGNNDINYDTIVISDVAKASCNAYFTFIRDTSMANYTYIFTDHSIHTNDSITSWSWNFGDSSPTSHIQHPIHQYSSLGTYNVVLNINTINGCNSSYTANIIISSGTIDCYANFTFSIDTNASSPYAIKFHDNSLHSTPINSWSWHFSDGDSSAFQDPQHEFPNAGIYNVKLKIITNNCESEIEIPIQVGNPQNYNFWGRVYVGNQTTDQCVAYLYRDFNNNYVIPIDTINLSSINDTLGVYYFYQIPEGNYKVQITIPSSSQFYEDYAPTYFNNSILWSGSQNIELYNDLSLQNIEMEPIILQYGTNFIEGSVQNLANGKLDDIIVFLINSQEQIIDYTYTNAQGDYSFSEVPIGNFYVYGDLTGFASYPAAVNFNTQNDSISNVNFLIKGRSSIGFIDKLASKTRNSIRIFPNPITDNSLNIIFNKTTNSNIHYYIYNSVGTEIQNGSFYNATKHTKIKLENIPKGIYFISLFEKDGTNIELKKFIVN